jgi:hypothetical protein
MRFTVALLVLTLTACGGVAVGADAPVGTLTLTTLNNQPLPAASPTEEGVTVTDGTLSLDADGMFALRLHATGAGVEAGERTVRGRWTMQNEWLVLRPDEPGASVQRYYVLRHGSAVRLVDEAGHTYDFRIGGAPGA